MWYKKAMLGIVTIVPRGVFNIHMLTTSSKEVTAIYEKIQNIDRHIQIKIEHPDNTNSQILESKYQQLVKSTLVSIEKPPLKTSFCISNQHFHSRFK